MTISAFSLLTRDARMRKNNDKINQETLMTILCKGKICEKAYLSKRKPQKEPETGGQQIQ